VGRSVVAAKIALALALALSPVCERAAAGRQPPRRAYAPEEKSIEQLQADLASGLTTSEDLVRRYRARIAAIDVAGPALHSVISLNRNALGDARRLDAERRAGRLRGPLHGIPVLIKDNIESDDGTATTAGSLALAANISHRAAPVVRRITDAGGIILGKTNLSEWANIRSSQPTSGWSAIGGLVKNPYVLDRNACGSSSGAGAAIAANLAAVGVGTETDGSVTCPAAFNSLVGLKPTVGLVSRTYVVPIAHSQDTPGPMARSVADVAILLTVMAGSDPADAATSGADLHKRDYAAGLSAASLRGKRLGVLRFAAAFSPDVTTLFDQAIAVLKAQGAEIIEFKDYKPASEIGDDEQLVLITELKVDLNRYLASTPHSVKARTLADLITFNRENRRELSLFGQELFEQAEATAGLDEPAYLKARENSLRLAGAAGIDKLVTESKLDALIAPSYGPAYRIDVVTGDHDSGSSSTLPAVAGYPHLTVPMGFIRGLPVGISFIGQAWTEEQLLHLGAAYERATHARRAPTYARSIEASPSVTKALAPAGNSSR
jgi:amidase